MTVRTHHLRCIGCGTVIPGEEARSDFRCPLCNELYEVIYAWSDGVKPEGAAVAPGAAAVNMPNPTALRYLWQERRNSTAPADQSGVWRFRDLFPILSDMTKPITLREGNTPLYDLPRCAKVAGLDTLLAKHQGMNPTGSFKDTGMTAALSVAAERGFEWVACASTGNTSAAMAAYAARAGLRSVVFIPEGKIAWGKLSQSMDYGALTIQLKTDFDGCVDLLTELVKRFPIYLLNSVNPYRLEGQKTPAFEILEQLNWEVPDHVIVPGGNLANSSALGKGFQELKHLGMISKVPKIDIIQAEGANPLYRWYMDENRVMKPVTAETRATAIRIGNPASWHKAANIIESMGGWCEQVSEQEIALAKAEIGAEGVGCEPASAVTFAGVKKLVRLGKLKGNERAVLILTGHTLKDPQYTIDYHRNELLKPEELAQASTEMLTQHEALKKAPLVMDANVDAVVRLMEERMKTSMPV